MKQKIYAVVLFALAVFPAAVALATGDALAYEIAKWATVGIVSLGLASVAVDALAFRNARKSRDVDRALNAHNYILDRAKAFMGRSKLKNFGIAARSIVSIVLLLALNLNILAVLVAVMAVMIYMSRGYAVRYLHASQVERRRMQRGQSLQASGWARPGA